MIRIIYVRSLWHLIWPNHIKWSRSRLKWIENLWKSFVLGAFHAHVCDFIFLISWKHIHNSFAVYSTFKHEQRKDFDVDVVLRLKRAPISEWNIMNSISDNWARLRNNHRIRKTGIVWMIFVLHCWNFRSIQITMKLQLICHLHSTSSHKMCENVRKQQYNYFFFCRMLNTLNCRWLLCAVSCTSYWKNNNNNN